MPDSLDQVLARAAAAGEPPFITLVLVEARKQACQKRGIKLPDEDSDCHDFNECLLIELLSYLYHQRGSVSMSDLLDVPERLKISRELTEFWIHNLPQYAHELGDKYQSLIDESR